MALTLDTIASGSTDYPSIVANNFSAIEAAINDLAAQILASVGDGSLLVLDMFDRDGIVGSASYRLDLDNYEGGATIDIGRRPVANVDLGDQDVSMAWITAGGQKTRVSLAGDVTLNAGGILNALPKTIYVGIPSSGTPQLYEDTTAFNVLYIYSMCWDAFQLTQFKRIAPILPGYTALQDHLGVPQVIQHLDQETNFLDDEESVAELVLHGAADDNEIGINHAVEVLGGFITFHGEGEDALFAPTGEGDEIALELQVESEAIRWNEEDIVFDASNGGNTIYFQVDKDVVGDDRFVTEYRKFKVSRVSIGSDVVSARRFTFGLFVRPILGTPIPKDDTFLDMI